jgi:hypothetical protein
MSRSNLFLALLVMGLACFYYLHDVKGKPEREKAETQSKRFFPDLEKPSVTGVTVECIKDGVGLTLFKHEMKLQNGVWVLQSNPPQVLRTASLGSTIKTLVELQKADTLSEKGETLNRAEFGLDKPSYRVTVQDKGQKSHQLLIGDKTPDEQGYYVSLNEQSEICAINSTLNELLQPETDNLRETSAIVFEPSTANKIVVESASGPPIEVALAQSRESEDSASETDDGLEITDLNEEWKLQRPDKAEADGAKVRNLLYDWRQVKLGRFMKGAEGIDFSKPIYSLTVHVDRQRDPFKLDIASAVPGKPGLYYARRSSPEEYLVLEVSDFKILEPKVKNLLQRHVYRFEPDEAASVKATLDGLEVVAKKGSSGWSLSQPKATGADAEKQSIAVGDLAWEVKNLEWDERLTADKAPKEWKERAKIEVIDKQKKSYVLALGPAQGKGAYLKDDKGNLYLLENDPFKRWQDIKKRIEAKGATTPTPTPSAAVKP